jgi:hypothetical protein
VDEMQVQISVQLYKYSTKFRYNQYADTLGTGVAIVGYKVAKKTPRAKLYKKF